MCLEFFGGRGGAFGSCAGAALGVYESSPMTAGRLVPNATMAVLPFVALYTRIKLGLAWAIEGEVAGLAPLTGFEVPTVCPSPGFSPAPIGILGSIGVSRTFF